MAHVPSHFWLEIQPAGEDARQARATRSEDRDLLVALGQRPSRVLDVHRRLRWSDGPAFQEALARAVARGWIRAHDAAPAPPASPPEPMSPATSPTSPLLALLARAAARLDEQAHFPGDSEPADGMPSDSGRSNWPLPDAAVALEETLPPPPPAPAAAPASEDPADRPWEKLPPSPPPSPEDEANLLAAMGLSADTQVLLPDAPDDAPPPAPSPGSAKGLLLQALLSGQDVDLDDPVVPVPAYGLAPAAPAPPPSDGFVRLRDVGAVRGPGDGPASTPDPTPVALAPGKDGPLTEGTRRRMRDRQVMLEAARREAADRRQARERAAARHREVELEEEQRQQRQQAHRVQEDASRAATFQGRAERARRLRSQPESPPQPPPPDGHDGTQVD